MVATARGAEPTLRLPAPVVTAIRAELPRIADEVVEQIIAEVPAYEDAFHGPMGETIRTAVQVAHGGFLSLVSGRSGTDARALTRSAVDGAYQLGRGEARSGRSTDALLSAYRIGARVSWREFSERAVALDLDARLLVSFAELVFAYIDQLSAASVAGHNDESATAGRVRQRLLERVVRHLLAGSPEATVLAAAERAEWTPPTTLTAVIAPEAQVAPLLQTLPPRTLQSSDLAELDAAALLLVPDVQGRRRAATTRAVAGRGCIVGPPRPWVDVRSSYARALRARALGLEGDTEEHLPRLVLTADPEALADLRERALAPLADLRPASRAKLEETLRAWLLHQGRREEVATALFVHPQTVRYRVGQLREAYGDALEDPETVLALTLALGVEPGEPSVP
ncbi:MAG TPA: helix-turn-helix domain-containing protein [Nocardioides sp.]|nr:helix-turn-helix domain-containing protein [Nocardioides sp.]